MPMMLQCMQSVLFLVLYTYPVLGLSVSVIQRDDVKTLHAVVAVLINEGKWRNDRYTTKRLFCSLHHINCLLAHCNSLERIDMRNGIKKLDQQIENLTKKVHTTKCLDSKKALCKEIRELCSLKRKMERS